VAPLFRASLRPQLRALAVTFVPETAGATTTQWAALEATVDRAVAARPASLGRQLILLIRLLDGLARLRHGKGLDRLDSGRRTRLLERLAVSRLPLLRRGIWGLRTLLMLGWYTQPEVAAALGYRATAAGWGARR
jgi:hypothetical protein